MTTADVVVVGAGVLGASIAFHLASRGTRVVVCDQGHVGRQGATPWSAGQVRLTHSDPADMRLAALSLPVFEQWGELVGGDCGFRATGFALLVDEDHRTVAATAVKDLDALGVEAQLLDADEYARRRPGLRYEGVAAVAFEPRSGYADPVATTRSLLERATGLGARVLTGTRVHSLVVDGDTVRGVRTGTGVISAAEVVLATNAWGAGLLAGTGVSVPLSVARVGWAAVDSAAVPGVDVTIDDTIGTYFRPWGEHGVLYRVPMDGRGGPPDTASGPVCAGLLEGARSLVALRVPALADRAVTASGSALESYTPDGKPVLGRAGPGGVYLALGPSGGGFKAAPAIGRAVAAELCGAGLGGAGQGGAGQGGAGQGGAGQGGAGLAEELDPYRFARFTGEGHLPVARRYRHM